MCSSPSCSIPVSVWQARGLCWHAAFCPLYSVLGQKGFHLRRKWVLRSSLCRATGACCRVTVVPGHANPVWSFGRGREVTEGWAGLQLSLGLSTHPLCTDSSFRLGRMEVRWVLSLVDTPFDWRACSAAGGRCEICLLWSELQVKWHPQGAACICWSEASSCSFCFLPEQSLAASLHLFNIRKNNNKKPAWLVLCSRALHTVVLLEGRTWAQQRWVVALHRISSSLYESSFQPLESTCPWFSCGSSAAPSHQAHAGRWAHCPAALRMMFWDWNSGSWYLRLCYRIKMTKYMSLRKDQREVSAPICSVLSH